jgi:predicted 3-demethylubiquinone-9 3-methyltransferase (glyoxalase superfamily)
MCIDSPIKHEFTFTPSTSLFVECESDAEIEEVFSRLSSGGNVLMPLGNYGFSTKFGWVKDRFGPSWQLNLS